MLRHLPQLFFITSASEVLDRPHRLLQCQWLAPDDVRCNERPKTAVQGRDIWAVGLLALFAVARGGAAHPFGRVVHEEEWLTGKSDDEEE